MYYKKAQFYLCFTCFKYYWKERNKKVKIRDNLANIITLSRIIFSLLMLLFPLFSIGFWVFYLLSGLSDVLDGLIARKFGTESKRGAILDSVADIVFFLIIGYLLLSSISLPLWLVICILIIALIRLAAYLISFIKFHSFVSIHTYLNKITGFSLFLTPLLYYFCGLEITGIILVIIAFISSIEELIIDILSKVAKRDCKGLFIK